MSNELTELSEFVHPVDTIDLDMYPQTAPNDAEWAQLAAHLDDCERCDAAADEAGRAALRMFAAALDAMEADYIGAA